MSPEKPVAVVTGASMGIGYELAFVFAEHGYNLLLVARKESLLAQHQKFFQTTFGVQVHYLALDLSLRENWPKVYQQAMDRFSRVDVLVNNAGYGLLVPFHQGPLDQFLNMIDLNVEALTALCHLFLPHMMERGRGKILNVASVAGFYPGPYMSVYYATKAYVVQFSLALYYEMRRHGVLVSALCPGPTSTHFGERSGMQNSLLFQFMASAPDSVARAAYRGLQKNRPLIVPGLLNKISVFLSRLTPRWLALRTVAWLQTTRINKAS